MYLMYLGQYYKGFTNNDYIGSILYLADIVLLWQCLAYGDGKTLI